MKYTIDSNKMYIFIRYHVCATFLRIFGLFASYQLSQGVNMHFPISTHDHDSQENISLSMAQLPHPYFLIYLILQSFFVTKRVIVCPIIHTGV